MFYCAAAEHTAICVINSHTRQTAAAELGGFTLWELLLKLGILCMLP